MLTYQWNYDNKCPHVNKEIVSSHLNNVYQSRHHWYAYGLHHYKGFNLILQEEASCLQIIKHEGNMLRGWIGKSDEIIQCSCNLDINTCIEGHIVQCIILSYKDMVWNRRKQYLWNLIPPFPLVKYFIPDNNYTMATGIVKSL